MAYKTLIVELADGISTIRLNRPEALNALNAVLLEELADALGEADRNDRVRVVVLTGSDKAFAAGADVGDMAERDFVGMFAGNVFGATEEAFQKLRKPVIAAVSGYALGGGCELAMMCDLIIAADTTRFGQPEINLGVVAGMGGTQRLTRAIGKAKSMDMHLTGRTMDAAEAERAGLVSRVVPARDLMKEATAVAAKIAEKSLITVMAVKEAVNRAQETTLREGLLFERRLFHALFATEDQKEGMRAFLEKRQPQFRDR